MRFVRSCTSMATAVTMLALVAGVYCNDVRVGSHNRDRFLLRKGTALEEEEESKHGNEAATAGDGGGNTGTKSKQRVSSIRGLQDIGEVQFGDSVCDGSCDCESYACTQTQFCDCDEGKKCCIDNYYIIDDAVIVPPSIMDPSIMDLFIDKRSMMDPTIIDPINIDLYNEDEDEGKELPCCLSWCPGHVEESPEICDFCSDHNYINLSADAEAAGTPNRFLIGGAGLKLFLNPCWGFSPGQYLAGCVSGDNCMNHGSITAAKTACIAAGDTCGGVLTGGSAGHWEIRRGTVPTGSTHETSYPKIDCAGHACNRGHFDYDNNSDLCDIDSMCNRKKEGIVPPNWGETNSENCPNGYTPIFDASICEQEANHSALNIYSPVEMDWIPAGCTFRPNQNTYYFNTLEVAATRANHHHAPVCQPAPVGDGDETTPNEELPCCLSWCPDHVKESPEVCDFCNDHTDGHACNRGHFDYDNNSDLCDTDSMCDREKEGIPPNWGERNSVNCPSGYTPIFDTAICEQEATHDALGIYTPVEMDWIPAGCTFRPIQNQYYFNTLDVAATRANNHHVPVCQPAPVGDGDETTPKEELPCCLSWCPDHVEESPEICDFCNDHTDGHACTRGDFDYEKNSDLCDTDSMCDRKIEGDVLPNWGETNSENCPNGYTPIFDAAICEQEANRSALNMHKPAEMNWIPAGCTFRPNQNQYYFNTLEVAATRGNIHHAPVCQLATVGDGDETTSKEEPSRSMCSDDVQLLNTIGTADYPSDAVEIVSQDTSTTPHTVTVNLNQQWSSTTPIGHIFTYYQETPFSKHCYENTDIKHGEQFETIIISCNYLLPLAYLEICVADKNVLPIEDDAVVPKCCYPTFPPDTPVVCYSLQISCEPCETE